MFIHKIKKERQLPFQGDGVRQNKSRRRRRRDKVNSNETIPVSRDTLMYSRLEANLWNYEPKHDRQNLWRGEIVALQRYDAFDFRFPEQHKLRDSVPK